MGCLRWGFLVMLMMLAWPSAAMSTISTWGDFGTGEGQFMMIGGIAVDSVGNVYVVDIPRPGSETGGRVQKFTNTGVFISEWGSPGAGDGQFSRPSGVAVDSSNRVYVADRSNQRIQRFDSSGGFQISWGVGGDVLGVGLLGSGSVYVTHAGHGVQRYDSDGNPLGSWGGLGAGNGQFNFGGTYSTPAVDAAGNVYASDAGNDRVQKFDADGTFILKWGSPQFGDFDPSTVAVGPDGAVYVPIGSGGLATV
jgi:tripartite motif-containing protein 71